MASKQYVNPVKTSLLGLAVSRFMAETGLKTVYVRQQCQIGSGRLNSLKKVNWNPSSSRWSPGSSVSSVANVRNSSAAF